METPNGPNYEAAAAVTESPSDLSQRLANLLGRIAQGDRDAFAEFY
jgi:RNA polymerase sigma-70 factor (ECF subfamily)